MTTEGSPIARAKHTAAVATAITGALVVLKIAAGYVAGSELLIADGIHSGADLLALAASWFGLRLASREATERFPYGFYRAETIATLLVAAVIVIMGGALFMDGIDAISAPVGISHTWLALGTAVISISVALFLAIWERRVSRETNSQSLAATADEAMMDMVSSAVVLGALAVSALNIPYVAAAATMLVSLAVLRVGLQHGWTALLTLMDASIDPELEKSLKEMLLDIPGVRHVHRVRARRSGPYYFTEGHIHVAGTMDVNRSHMLTHEAEKIIHGREPRVEGVILHVEPYHSDTRRVLVPIEDGDDLNSRICMHFGRAPRYLTASVQDGEITDVRIIENPFVGKKVRAGLAVINRFACELHLDAIAVREIGEIAFHAMRDCYIDILQCDDTTARECLRSYMAGELTYLTEATHSSEESPGVGPTNGN
jgi:cation diffusion facilitator family transporter